MIAFVRFEPERERIANNWNDADEFVNQNIEGHASEKDLRYAKPSGLNQSKRRN